MFFVSSNKHVVFFVSKLLWVFPVFQQIKYSLKKLIFILSFVQYEINFFSCI